MDTRLLFPALLLIALRADAAPPARPAPLTGKPIPPAISTSSSVKEYRRAEASLGRFITALQTGRRAEAAEYFSSQVNESERRTFLAGEWPRKDPSRTEDLYQILFHYDLQIRVRSIYQGMLRLYVLPRRIASRYRLDKTGKIVKSPTLKGTRAGYVEVVMRKEQSAWKVDLHPAPLRRASAG